MSCMSEVRDKEWARMLTNNLVLDARKELTNQFKECYEEGFSQARSARTDDENLASLLQAHFEALDDYAGVESPPEAARALGFVNGSIRHLLGQITANADLTSLFCYVLRRTARVVHKFNSQIHDQLRERLRHPSDFMNPTDAQKKRYQEILNAL